MKKIQLSILTSLLVICCSFSASAQLVGWSNKDAISVKENNGVNHTNYQVLLTLNTKELITATKMKADGSDIRFAEKCDGSNVLNYFIESGINTEKTNIWVKLNSLPASQSVTLFMFYGNATATAATSFPLTFPKSRTLTTPLALTADSADWNYDWIEIKSGGSITLAPGYGKVFKMTARKIIIDGNITGDGAGAAGGATTSGEGPGAGGTKSASGGGGGYGGNGGDGSWCCSDSAGFAGNGGLAYGTSDMITDIDAGSGGAGTLGGGVGGAGGAGLSINAAFVSISSTISMNGIAGQTGFYTGGGGSGGGVLVKTGSLNLAATAKINTIGGDGGNPTGLGYDSGGGGGGRIKLFYQHDIKNLGALAVTPGKKGSGGVVEGRAGNIGTIFTGLTDIGEPDITITKGIDATVRIKNNVNTICQGNGVTFTAIPGNGGTAPTYQWKINNTAVNGATNDIFTTNTLNAGDSVSCDMVSNSGCTNNPVAFSNSLKINVLPVLAASFTKSSGDTVKTLESIAFTSTGAGANKWFWDFGDGGTSNKQNPVHSYTGSGLFLITHIAFNDGCSDTSTTLQNVKAEAAEVEAKFSHTDSLLFVRFQNLSNNSTSYEWNFGDGVSSTDLNPNHTYSSPGSYLVTLVAINDNLAINDTTIVGITLTNQIKIAKADYSFIANELAVTFTNASANATEYIWNFGDGSALNTNENPSHTYTVDGTYTVSLIAKNNNNSDTTIKDITVQKMVSGLNQKLLNNLSVYPNPSNSIIYFKDIQFLNSVTIFGIDGHTALILQDVRNSIDISTLPNGMYTIKANTLNKAYYGKFIKN